MSFKKQIATLLNIKVEDVEKAIEEDKKIDISGITVFSDEELESNNSAIAEKSKNETIKDISGKIGVDIEKTEDLAGAIAEKFSDEDSKKQITEMTEKLAKSGEETELLKSENTNLKKEKTNLLKSQKIGSIIPDNYTVNREDIKDIYLMKANVDIDESGELYFKNADGTAKVDKKNQIIRPTQEDVIAFLDSRGYAKKEDNNNNGGSGNNNGGQNRRVGGKFSGIQSVDDIIKYAEENKIDTNSDEYKSLVTEIYDANPDIAK